MRERQGAGQRVPCTGLLQRGCQSMRRPLLCWRPRPSPAAQGGGGCLRRSCCCPKGTHRAALADWHKALQVVVGHRQAPPVDRLHGDVHGHVVLLRLADALPEGGGLQGGVGAGGWSWASELPGAGCGGGAGGRVLAPGCRGCCAHPVECHQGAACLPACPPPCVPSPACNPMHCVPGARQCPAPACCLQPAPSPPAPPGTG